MSMYRKSVAVFGKARNCIVNVPNMLVDRAVNQELIINASAHNALRAQSSPLKMLTK
jgi:hypothetical protein